MKKIMLFMTGIILFSCSTNEITDDQNLIDEIESLANNEEVNSEINDSITSKDTDNDGINDAADADVNGDGILDNGTDSDGDGINDLADVDNDRDGIDDNGTDIDEDGINDDFDDDIDGDGISNEDDEYRNLSDTSLSSSVQAKITNYINENHSGKTITEVEIENQIIEIELSGNIELSFTLSGDYLTTEVDDENDENEYRSLSSSPLSEAVQQKIVQYINDNFPNDTVTEVEIENREIEIELLSDIELIFDLNGNFLRQDRDD